MLFRALAVDEVHVEQGEIVDHALLHVVACVAQYRGSVAWEVDFADMVQSAI